MAARLYGATLSSGFAKFALKTVADDYEMQCGSSAANFIRKDFYVYDGFKSMPIVKKAITLIK